VDVSVREAKEVLGWDVDQPFKAAVTYREYIAGGAAETDEGGEREIGEQDIAAEIVKRTPEAERKLIKEFYLSPDAFEMSVRRANQSKISDLLGQVFKANDLPYPVKADNARVDGWSLMYNMLLETKRHARSGQDCWLISNLCQELINAVPLLMRNPKNLDDVLKTDEKSAKIEQDAADTGRYGLKSMLSPGRKPIAVQIQEAVAKAYEIASDPRVIRTVPVHSDGEVVNRYVNVPGPAVAVTPNQAAYLALKKAEKKFQAGPIVRMGRNWRRGQ
jgi:hypothetical protein